MCLFIVVRMCSTSYILHRLMLFSPQNSSLYQPVPILPSVPVHSFLYSLQHVSEVKLTTPKDMK